MDFFSLITKADLVIKLIMVFLVLLSVVSWASFLSRYLFIFFSIKRSRSFYKNFMKNKDMDKAYVDSQYFSSNMIPSLYASGYVELKSLSKNILDNSSLNNVQRAMMLERDRKISLLRSGVANIATTGAIAPFIGLFGTVWGIMNAFIGLSNETNSTLAAVAPGIAEALITTALGLGAAIPAVLFFNKLSKHIDRLETMGNNFIYEFINIVYRTFVQSEVNYEE